MSAAYTTPPTLIPTAVFALPPLATVGLTQDQAVSSFGANDVEIYKTKFRPMRFTLPKKEEKVLMKLVVRRSTQLVAGVHMVGADAPEIIQALAVALTCGATKAQFDRTLALHPSVGEEFVLLREPSKPFPLEIGGAPGAPPGTPSPEVGGAQAPPVTPSSERS